MKKTLSALLVGSMLMFPVPALASDDNKTPEVIHSLAFEEIQKAVENRNPDLEILVNQKSIIDEQFDAQEDEIRASFAQAQIQVLGQRAFYESLVSYYTGLQNEEKAIDPASTKYQGIIDIYQGMINGLNSQGSPSFSDDMEDNLDENKGFAFRQLNLKAEVLKNSLVKGIQQSFLGYQTLKDTASELESQKELLEKQLTALKLQESLGLVTASTLDPVELGIKKMDTNLDTLKNSLDDIEANINLLLGQPYDTSLVLGDLPKLDNDELNDIRYDSDYETAMDNNLSLRLKMLEYETKDYAADYAEDEGNNHDEQIADDERDNILIEIDSLEREIALMFDQAYRNVQDKETAVDLAQRQLENVQTTWQQTQLKYDLGLISQLEMKKVKADYDTEKRNLQSVQQELFSAFNDYQWIINGMDV